MLPRSLLLVMAGHLLGSILPRLPTAQLGSSILKLPYLARASSMAACAQQRQTSPSNVAGRRHDAYRACLIDAAGTLVRTLNNSSHCP